MSDKLSSADQMYLSAEQQKQILALKQAWAEANAAGDREAMTRANQQAEAIRAQAGYAGGSDGSGYTRLGAGVQAGQSAEDVQKWVDQYRYTNYSDRNGWINGFSTDMNLRSMANYIRQQMQANSDAWAAADDAGKAYLHGQNLQLAKILEDAVGGARSTYNEALGRWETTNAYLGYGYNVGQYNDPDWYRNAYGMTDEQMEAFRSDTARYRNFVDQRVVRNWMDESNGYTGKYAQFVNGPYGQLLNGTANVDPTVYTDVIGDGFGDDSSRAPTGPDGSIVPQLPALKNNNSMTDYTRQFASYVDENGVIQPGSLVQSHPGRGTGASGGRITHSTGSSNDAGDGDFLDQWRQAAEAQTVQARDAAVDRAVQQLLQAQAEADALYQTQREQITREERNALDNAALYAEARGDRGGIGREQYNQIQATAAANRQAVNSAQAQLAADKARQMAQLRADGEFEKADSLLEIAQVYLLKLLELEQWAAEYQLDTQKFQQSVSQWQQEFALKAAKALI